MKQILERMHARIKATAAAAGPDAGFPHIGLPDGTWVRSPAGDWTGGFWVGELWLTARCDQSLLPHARSWSDALRPRATSATVFRSSLFYYGAVLGAELHADEGARRAATEGARQLAASFHVGAGVIPLGTAAEEASDVGNAETSIDAVGAVSGLLAWAGADQAERARAHARWNLRHLVRDDGSVCQSATLDPTTGDLRRTYTHKGSGPNSTWARAQAWGLLAATLSARWLPTTREEMTAYGRRIADWWLAQAPDDLVAYWDFDVTQAPPTERDTSATAITAVALLKLAALTGDDRYRQAAVSIVEALGRRVTADGALVDACYNPRIGLACRNELIWGDYFLLEALHILTGDLDPLAV